MLNKLKPKRHPSAKPPKNPSRLIFELIPNKPRCIVPAAFNECKRKVEYVLEHGSVINMLQYGFYTVITNEATAGAWPMFLWLWDKGADPMKTGKDGSNVAVWVQERMDGTGLTEDGERIKTRLESIGVKFPYRPAKKDNTETER